MSEDKDRYIILNADGTPAEKLSDGGHPLKEVEDFDHLGLLVREPFIVLDFDAKDEAETMLRIAEGENLQCPIMQTKRGYHFWFKSPEPWKNFVKARLAIGLHADCRSYGKLSYVKIKLNGDWREWPNNIYYDDAPEVPAWLHTLAHTKYNFHGMGAGDGRNQLLYEYILVMQTKGYTQAEITETVRIINKYVFSEALEDNEIENITRPGAFKDPEEMQAAGEAAFWDDEGKFKHNLFAIALIQNLNVVTVFNTLYTYRDGYYQRANRMIERRMIDLYPTIKMRERAEVIDYIKILSDIDPNQIEKHEYLLNLNNTMLNVHTLEQFPHDPSYIDFARVPVTYDPTAYDKTVDDMLDRVFLEDQDVRSLFEEMLGYCLVKNTKYRKGFLFSGNGQNGKSTVLKMIKAFLGEENTTALSLHDLSKNFRAAELTNKLANIGDDIDAREISDTGIMKKLFTGEPLLVERKHKDPYELRNYAKMMFSANKIPYIKDKSEGIYSRFMFIPFNAHFTADDPSFDPFIDDKVVTPNALSYLLNLALTGLKRLTVNRKFTEPEIVMDAMEEYKIENSNVLSWVEEENITKERLLGETVDKHYSDFKDWCNREDIKYVTGKKMFNREIESCFGLERKRRYDPITKNNGPYRYVSSLDGGNTVWKLINSAPSAGVR